MRLPICLALLLSAAVATVACGKVRDNPDHNRSRDSASRIVSLTPSATALLEELGGLEHLVGRDKFSVSPESIQSLPVVGDFATPNVEAIVALRPDLVLLDASQEKSRRALEALDVPLLVLQMHGLDDVSAGLTALGEAIGKKELAEARTRALQRAFQQFSIQGKQRKHQPRVLLIIDRAPDQLRNLVAAGPGSYLDELLTIVGGTNAMADSSVLYPQLGAEQILRTAPDIIIDVSHSAGGAEAYAVVAEVPAVAKGRVFVIDEPNMRAPTPRADEALERLFELTSL